MYSTIVRRAYKFLGPPLVSKSDYLLVLVRFKCAHDVRVLLFRYLPPLIERFRVRLGYDRLLQYQSVSVSMYHIEYELSLHRGPVVGWVVVR